MDDFPSRTFSASALRLNADDIDALQLADIRSHAARRGVPTAYVAPLAMLLPRPAGDDDERCVVIALPHTDANDVDVSDKCAATIVVGTPEGGRAACLLLAANRVALAERAVVDARPLAHKRFIVLWAFTNATALQVHAYHDELEEALWLASMAAQSHERPEGDDEPPVDDPLICVFDVFDVGLTSEAGLAGRRSAVCGRSPG
ncbi:hypothetical protein [Caballeronia sp. GAFFF1]|uniref:hypothetical protein n=1 Tax=Caballeronia sp. GAFFF1 TaxID=2921779 RepID=UPI00202896C4|nr:hypothetical protein [Caballeronia sp. GAFFF1]